jgi:hypothetical protein
MILILGFLGFVVSSFLWAAAGFLVMSLPSVTQFGHLVC